MTLADAFGKVNRRVVVNGESGELIQDADLVSETGEDSPVDDTRGNPQDHRIFYKFSTSF